MNIAAWIERAIETLRRFTSWICRRRETFSLLTPMSTVLPYARWGVVSLTRTRPTAKGAFIERPAESVVLTVTQT